VKDRAGKFSLQPEALGADQEATNGLKHSENGLFSAHRGRAYRLRRRQQLSELLQQLAVSGAIARHVLPLHLAE
jgi:hypothetical protein